jgi:hypothetical protein
MPLINLTHKDSEHHEIDEWIVDTLQRVTAYEYKGFSKFDAWEVACSAEGARPSTTVKSHQITEGRKWD